MSKKYSLTKEQLKAIRNTIFEYREKRNLTWDEMAEEFGLTTRILYRMVYYGTGLAKAPMILRLLDMDWGVTRKHLDYDDETS